MHRKQKRIFVVLALVALLAFAAWPVYDKWLRAKAVSAVLHQKTAALVANNPQLRPAWDAAMKDGVLTWSEAKGIFDQVGEPLDPEE